MRRTLFQVVFGLVGLVALTFGALSALFGSALIPGGGTVSASVESELRFYAVWYAAAGVAILWTLRRVEEARPLVRAISGAFFIAGAVRVISIIAVGRPDSIFVVLMVIELALPFVLIPWHNAITRVTSDQQND